MANDKVYYLAPDLGNSYTDVITPTGSLVTFPSLISPGRVRRYHYNFDAGNEKSSYMDNMLLTDSEGSFFVGHAAYDNADPSKIKLAHDQGQSLGLKEKLLKVAMGLSLPQSCQVKLVLGHPYSDADLAGDMAKMAMGRHEYTLNGLEYGIDVVEVDTISQPVAAFLGYVTGSDGKALPQYADLLSTPVVVIDIGGGTWDVCWIEKNGRTGRLEVKDHLSGSDRFGVWYALQIAQEEIYARYQIKKELVDLEYELDGTKTKINLDGKMVDVQQIKDNALAQAAADGITFTTNLHPALIRSKIGKVISTGGGSIKFKPYLLTHYDALFGDRYCFASKDLIARGQHSKAQRLWGR